MNPKLSKQPVTYVLAQIKFTSIENIAEYVSKLQDSIRERFPHFQDVSMSAIQFKENSVASPMTWVQWHFIDKEKQTGIILDKQSIAIHTTDYTQYHSLISSFGKVIEQFYAILNISLFTRLGLRYINLIEEGLSDINSGLKGFQLSGTEFNEQKQYISQTQTTQQSQKGHVKIQATHVGNKELLGDNKFLLPFDLIDTVKVLSFKNLKEPQNDFLILDIDHFNNEQGDFEIKEILNQFDQLHETAYQVFCQAVGTTNLQNWK